MSSVLRPLVFIPGGFVQTTDKPSDLRQSINDCRRRRTPLVLRYFTDILIKSGKHIFIASELQLASSAAVSARWKQVYLRTFCECLDVFELCSHYKVSLFIYSDQLYYRYNIRGCSESVIKCFCYEFIITYALDY